MYDDHKAAKDVSYIGETSRPFRESVCTKPKKWKHQIIMISHWMEVHGTSTEAPQFKCQVLDSYTDALIPQLGEGLHILEAGVLNRKLAFHNNIICRMQATVYDDLSEKQLQQELDKRKVYNHKIKNFIHIMSKISSVID